MARPEPPVTVAINALFWRHHLTADFAGLMILRVHVDVPLADGKLLRLLGGQRRVSRYRRLNRPLGLSQITGGPFLPPAIRSPSQGACSACLVARTND
jgi:hypothetical protein